MPDEDAVDLIHQQWRAVRPDLDTRPVGVVGRISRASRLLERGTREHFATYDLQPWEFDVLAALRRAGKPYQLTAGQLMSSMMVSAGAITNRIDRLVAKGLVDRDTDPTNRRSVLITLTGRGRHLVDEVAVSHLETEERLISALGPRERDQLTRLLRKLLVALGDT